MAPSVPLLCPVHGAHLSESLSVGYRCPQGCDFPIVDGIPRFVPLRNYAAGFGVQWNAFHRTQLDSHTGTTLSADRLERIVGGDLEIFRGKMVLEAGCGAGRFTEVMLQHGAIVFAADISRAVEANYLNHHQHSRYFVCQADVTKLPIEARSFDIVVCVGVVQHTPDPEATMSALARYVKPGGMLFLDHYTPDYPATPSRRAFRKLFLKLPSRLALPLCRFLVAALWPLHVLSFRARATRVLWRARNWVLRFSPVVDYHEAYPQLGPKGLYQWAMLDTHDTLTDTYKHFRTGDQIRSFLAGCGMTSIETQNAGNGVEVRAMKAAAETSQTRFGGQ